MSLRHCRAPHEQKPPITWPGAIGGICFVRADGGSVGVSVVGSTWTPRCERAGGAQAHGMSA